MIEQPNQRVQTGKIVRQQRKETNEQASQCVNKQTDRRTDRLSKQASKQAIARASSWFRATSQKRASNKANNNSGAQSRPFNLLVFSFWSIFSHGPKRLTFYFQVLWAIETKAPGPKGSMSYLSGLWLPLRSGMRLWGMSRATRKVNGFLLFP